MHRRLLFAILLLTSATTLAPAAWSLTEVFGDDVLVWSVGTGLDADVNQPALAHDPTHDQYLVTWSEDPGDAGFRVQTGIVDAATGTGVIGPTGFLDAGTGQAREVSAAFDPVSGLYLVVWSQDVDAPGAFEVFGRYVGTDNQPAGPAFAISAAGSDPLDPAFDALEPDVAADGDGNFLVVWSADDDVLGFGSGNSDLYARRLPAGVTAPTSTTHRVSDMSSGGTLLSDALAPAVAHYPDRDEWGLVYEFDADPGAAVSPIVDFRVLAADGSLITTKLAGGGESLVGPGGAAKALPQYYKAPDIAFDRRERQFLAVWETNSGGEPQIVGRRVLADYSFGPGPIAYSTVSSPPNAICIARDAAVSYSFATGRFLVGWSGTPASGPTCPGLREIVVREVEPDGNPIGSGPTVISSMGDGIDPARTAVSPALIASDAGHRGLFAFWSGDPVNSGEFEAFGQFLTMDVATAVDDGPQRAFVLDLGAAPNPFNPSTVLSYELPEPGPVRLEIYDLRGARVRTLVDEARTAGRHQVRWTGEDHRGRSVASGVYFVRLTHAQGVLTQKVALVE